MEFNINEIIKSIGLKKFTAIILVSLIIFLLIPDNISQYVGSKITNILLWQKIILFVIIILIVVFFIEIVIPICNKIFIYVKKKMIVKNLDEIHIEYINKFYDEEVKEFIKTVSIYNDDKYILSLREKGIIEWITPLIITSNTPNTYKVSSEYKNILKKLLKNRGKKWNIN